MEEFARCRVCHSTDRARIKMLTTIPTAGIYDVGECCLSLVLSQPVTLPKPPEPIHESLALKLMAMGVR